MKQCRLLRAVHRVDVQVAALTSAAVLLTSALLVAVIALNWSQPARLRILIPCVAAGCCGASCLCSRFFFRRLSNPCARHLAEIDCLTELKNRNSFDIAIGNLNPRHCHGVGVVLIDLNDLKAVNDNLGHAYGDRYLRQAADVLRTVQTPSRTAYRIGGDEFVLLCRDCTEDELANLARKLCLSYESTRPCWSVTTSFSAGAALFDPERDMSLSDTLRRADAEMYLSKWRFHGGAGPILSAR